MSSLKISSMAEEEGVEEEEFDVFGDHPGTVARESLVVTSSGTADPNYRIGAFTIAEEGEEPAVSVPVIAIAVVNSSLLVAVPSSAWHRLQRQRVLPATALYKAAPVEVASVHVDDRSLVVGEVVIRVWIGLLKKEYEDQLLFPAPFGTTTIFPSTDGSVDFLPFAEGLLQIADDKFAFLTAESGSARAAGTSSQDARIAMLEENMVQIKTALQDLKSPPPPAPAAFAVGASAKPPPALRRPGVSGFPGLEADVVQSALAAGIDASHLEELSKIIGQKQTKLQDAPVSGGARARKTKFDILGEPVEDLEQTSPVIENVGAEDPMTSALVKLTNIVQVLASPKKGRLLDDAWDEVGLTQDSSASASTLGTSSRKHSAVLRALKKALKESPGELYRVLEERMRADFGCPALGPGEPQRDGSWRGWCEHRPKIPNINTSVRLVWGICGALDALKGNRPEEAQARLALLVSQIDQVAVDRGQWTLTSTMSLEEAPPLSSFSRHVPPDFTEPQHSKLLPTSWAEAFMYQVRELDDFIERRAKLGKRSGGWDRSTENSPEKSQQKAEKGGKGKKGKGKAGAAQSSSDPAQAAEPTA